ncbi:MAG: DNA primase [Treponema sp.]|nr:DNA primase [Treponema sp.]
MKGFISQASIDEVSAKTDIVQVIGEYVQLTQKGSDWWGCCPFHNEKTPSFSVSAEKKFYYCFGCHAKGTVFNFIMDRENLSYPEAILFLAKKAGVSVQYTDSGSTSLPRVDPDRQLKEDIISLYNRVSGAFHYLLMETEAGRFALDYISKRGLSRETLEKFRLGYAPADRRWLKAFLRKKSYSDGFLAKTGLFSERYPDISFFSDRLMFPICNKDGDVVAFGGRFLRGNPETSPKYLNSRELMHYKKGEILFAYHFARKSIKQQRTVVFCEGYMDCIAYHQCGVTYAVAPLGTALTESQVRLVRHDAETILLSFDSDSAGQNATSRAILMCRSQGFTVKVIRLSGGKDPAEIMLNFGQETLTNDVKNAILDSDYLLSKLLEVYPKNSPEGKAKASLEFFPYIDALQSDVQKEACLDQFCQAFDVDPEAARKDYTNRDRLARRFERKAQETGRDGAQLPKIKLGAELRAVMTAITDDASLFQKMRNALSVDDLDDPEAKKLFILLEECFRSGTFSVSNILNRCDSDELRGLIIQSTAEYANHVEQSLQDSIRLIQTNVLEKRSRELLNRIRRLECSSLAEDKDQLASLLSQKMDVDQQLTVLKG